MPHVHIANQRITFNGRDSGGQVSGFAQDNIQLGGRVTADLGLRIDRYALVIADTHVSPRVNVAYCGSSSAARHQGGLLQLAMTGYYRATDNPVHTIVWPDARIYTYAGFDRGGLTSTASRVAASRGI